MVRGISVLSGVIFLALVAASVYLVYQSGVPMIRNMQSSAAVERMKDVFLEMDEAIQQTASEGRGSKRNLNLRIDSGKLKINGSQNAIIWELETGAEVVSPRTSQRIGNVVIGANMESTAWEGNYTLASPEIPCYILDNGHLRAYIRRIGLPSSHASIDTGDILVALLNRDTGEWLNSSNLLEISIDGNATSEAGTGYTRLVESGYNLPYAVVTAFVNSSYADYYVNFTLESGADFLELEADG